MADHGIRLPTDPHKTAWPRRYFLYCLTFPNGQQYIGVTNDEWHRLRGHVSKARKDGADPVHQAIREQGVPHFATLCVGPRDYIADLEGKAIKAFGCELNLLIGRNHCAVTKAKLSAARMGMPTWNKGIDRTPEERTAIKAGLDASEKTEGARRKLADLNRSRVGIPSHVNQKAASSLAHKGKPKSPEQRAKMAEARRRWWERKQSGKKRHSEQMSFLFVTT